MIVNLMLDTYGYTEPGDTSLKGDEKNCWYTDHATIRTSW